MRRSRASEARMVGESFELSIASCAQCRRLTCGKTTHHCDPRRPACCSTVIIGTLNRILGTLKPHHRYPQTALSAPLQREPRRPACFSTVIIGTLNRITGTLKPHYRYPLYRIIGTLSPRSTSPSMFQHSAEPGAQKHTLHRCSAYSSGRHAQPVAQRTAGVACLSSVPAQRTANRRVRFLSDSAATPTAPFARGGVRCKARPNPNPLLRWVGGRAAASATWILHAAATRRRCSAAQNVFAAAWRRCRAAQGLGLQHIGPDRLRGRLSLGFL
jgi:hypothetical protein